MNFSKLLTALVAVTASANMGVYGGIGAFGGYTAPSFKTGDLFDAGDVTISGDLEAEGTNGVKFNKDVKGNYPLGVFGDVMVVGEGFAGPLALGASFRLGYQWNVGLPTDGIYGSEAGKYTAAAAAAPAKFGFAVKYPEGSFFMQPAVVIGAAVMDMHLFLRLGVDISKATYKLEYATGATSVLPAAGAYGMPVTTDLNAWLFAFVIGLQAVFQIGPCTGVAASVDFKYWPTSWNDIKEKDIAAKFKGGADSEAVVANIGGTWAITGGLTAFVTM